MKRLPLCVFLCALASCQGHQVKPVEPLTEAEIIKMSKEGAPPEVIIQKIRESGTVYIMDAGDIVKLHEVGVDDKVINYMMDTQRWDIEQRARAYYWDPYPWGPYYYYPPYPPWPHAHVGFGWHCW